jgi:hypothetical protein
MLPLRRRVSRNPPLSCHSDRSRSASDGGVEEPAVCLRRREADERWRSTTSPASSENCGVGFGVILPPPTRIGVRPLSRRRRRRERQASSSPESSPS